jgi:hypothetical protein
MAAEDPKAVHYFALNANILRNRVKAAMDDWITTGYKDDYEAMASFIDQVMQRDMTLLKAEYKDALDKARLTGLASGSDFYYSAVVPGNWVSSTGWTNFSFASGDFHRYDNHEQTQTSGGFSFFGLFGGGGGHTQEETTMRFNSEDFSLSFGICQVPIVRPWFKNQFLVSKSWRFDQSNAEAKGQMVSDGRVSAQGLIPAYPTSMICIKDLRLNFAQHSGFENFVSQNTSGGFGVSLGPFSLGGSHSFGDSTKNVSYQFDEQGMSIKGMAVIGFKCHIVPRSPDPLKTITKWV